MKIINNPCSYFAEYMRVKGLKIGDPEDQVNYIDYMSWITGHHSAFQKLTGRIDSWSEGYKELFMIYLRGERI